ncbi:MAG: hypothetical protein ACYCOX_02160 [Acidobacteriaceae bacterium]
MHSYSGHSLAEWLNDTDHEHPARAAVVAAIHGLSTGKGALSAAAMELLQQPVQGRVRVIDGVLDMAGHDDRAHAIFLLRDVTAAGTIGRLRECPWCGKWFFADNLKKQMCSDSCRSSAWASAHQDDAGIKASAQLRNRMWKLQNERLPGIQERIARYRTIQRELTKAEAAGLERAIQRQRAVKSELRKLKVKRKDE